MSAPCRIGAVLSDTGRAKIGTVLATGAVRAGRLAVMVPSLLELAQDGHGDAFAQLVDPYRPELHRYC